ncbi:hypothetical protein GJ25_gp007 [Mycobacterium phage Hawkeye]|uniref:Uncharacterized protein n=1 Tax=Mycobacterium phage Hawkeye TaxID=1458711 RepID=X2KRE7_9CAUD|nr:hypothetical protein GJ25_gp007 [Mycobacterium phage Hawkeye]AHN84018.1 hypothetical protein PBI_HAWKEYE_7 [Mycobacterium phage Hawkeye]
MPKRSWGSIAQKRAQQKAAEASARKRRKRSLSDILKRKKRAAGSFSEVRKSSVKIAKEHDLSGHNRSEANKAAYRASGGEAKKIKLAGGSSSADRVYSTAKRLQSTAPRGKAGNRGRVGLSKREPAKGVPQKYPPVKGSAMDEHRLKTYENTTKARIAKMSDTELKRRHADLASMRQSDLTEEDKIDLKLLNEEIKARGRGPGKTAASQAKFVADAKRRTANDKATGRTSTSKSAQALARERAGDTTSRTEYKTNIQQLSDAFLRRQLEEAKEGWQRELIRAEIDRRKTAKAKAANAKGDVRGLVRRDVKAESRAETRSSARRSQTGSGSRSLSRIDEDNLAKRATENARQKAAERKSDPSKYTGKKREDYERGLSDGVNYVNQLKHNPGAAKFPKTRFNSPEEKEGYEKALEDYRKELEAKRKRRSGK